MLAHSFRLTIVNDMVSYTEEQLRAYEMRRSPKIPRVEPPKGVNLESELHEQIEDELKRRRIYYVHSRMDRATTTQLGVTDFICAMPNGKTLWCECKRKNGKLTPEQNITRHILLAAGHWHVVVYCIEDFLKLL